MTHRIEPCMECHAECDVDGCGCWTGVESDIRDWHGMMLSGTRYRCAEGHEAEAAPADVMRAAGVPQLL